MADTPTSQYLLERLFPEQARYWQEREKALRPSDPTISTSKGDIPISQLLGLLGQGATPLAGEIQTPSWYADLPELLSLALAPYLRGLPQVAESLASKVSPKTMPLLRSEAGVLRRFEVPGLKDWKGIVATKEPESPLVSRNSKLDELRSLLTQLQSPYDVAAYEGNYHRIGDLKKLFSDPDLRFVYKEGLDPKIINKAKKIIKEDPSLLRLLKFDDRALKEAIYEDTSQAVIPKEALWKHLIKSEKGSFFNKPIGQDVTWTNKTGVQYPATILEKKTGLDGTPLNRIQIYDKDREIWLEPLDPWVTAETLQPIASKIDKKKLVEVVKQQGLPSEFITDILKSERGSFSNKPLSKAEKIYTPEYRKAVLEGLATTPERKKLIEEVLPSLEKAISEVPRGTKGYVFGSYPSFKSTPSDLDVFLEYPSLGQWGRGKGIAEGVSRPLHVIPSPPVSSFSKDPTEVFKSLAKGMYGPEYDWIRILGVAGLLPLMGLGGKAEAQIVDPSHRGTIVQNPSGSTSSERTGTFEIDGKFYNIPTLIKGKQYSGDQAVELFMKNLIPAVGVADTLEEALRMAEERSKSLGEEK